MIESTVSLTYMERIKAMLAVASSSIGKLFWLAVTPTCGLVLLAVVGGSGDWLDYMMVAFLLLYFPALLSFGAYRAMKAARKRGPTVYQFGPEGIHLRQPTAELNLYWPGVIRIGTKLGLLFVYPNKRCAYPLPLSGFADGQVESILAWAREGGAQRVNG